jgi:hypothetical protein
MFQVNRHPDRRTLRNFAWAMLGGFAALAVIAWLLPAVVAWWKGDEGWSGLLGWHGGRGRITSLVFLALGVVLWGLGSAPEALARRTYVAWMSVVVPIGVMMTIVMLTLLFFVFLPVFTLVRFSDPLRLRRRGATTYWEDARPHEATLERMMHPF